MANHRNCRINCIGLSQLRNPPLFKASIILVICAFSPIAVRAQTVEPGNSAKRTIYSQPILSGVAGNFHVPKVEKRYPSEQVFNLILWQVNASRPDGQLVSTNWRAGDKTGFYPSDPLSEHQSAFRDEDGSSTVQIEKGTVGVYLNSGDLPNQSSGDKMMITPEFRQPKEQWIYPFAEPGKAVVESLQLQIPVANDLDQPGNMTYVVA